MGECAVCGKKLGMFQGYETIDKEYCEECYMRRAEDKDKQRKEEINKKVEEKREKLEKLKNPNEKEVLIQILNMLKWIGLILFFILIYFTFR